MRGCFDDFLRSYSPLIRNILDNDEHHEIQILYTQVDRDSKNNPILNEYEYGVEAGNYFYPASSIKLPAALVALEKMAALSVPNLNRDTPLKIKISHNSQTAVDVDNSAHKGQPTLAHYIRKLFVVSDNDAYDRLYEWVGQHCLNETLWAKGYLDIRLTHRLSQPMSLENNRYTNEFVFYVEDGEIFRQPSQFSKEIFSVTSPILKGVGEVVDGVFKKKPKDFSGLNMVSVRILQDLMKAIVMPECLPVDRRFAISPVDRRFLLKVMSMLPFECNYPIYDRSKYYDSYVKFLMFGDSKNHIPSEIRIFNKAGLAYGYLIDNAYIVDLKRGVEFFLTVVISVNKNGIYNDGKYEYDELGFPFLSHIGRAVYEYETKRKRPHKADLSEFDFIGIR